LHPAAVSRIAGLIETRATSLRQAARPNGITDKVELIEALIASLRADLDELEAALILCEDEWDCGGLAES